VSAKLNREPRERLREALAKYGAMRMPSESPAMPEPSSVPEPAATDATENPVEATEVICWSQLRSRCLGNEQILQKVPVPS